MSDIFDKINNNIIYSSNKIVRLTKNYYSKITIKFTGLNKIQKIFDR